MPFGDQCITYYDDTYAASYPDELQEIDTSLRIRTPRLYSPPRPVCRVIISKGPDFQEIKFRNSQFTANQVRPMAANVVDRCTRYDHSENVFKGGGFRVVGMQTFVDVVRFPDRASGMD